jgi:hypothetical protein
MVLIQSDWKREGERERKKREREREKVSCLTKQRGIAPNVFIVNLSLGVWLLKCSVARLTNARKCNNI